MTAGAASIAIGTDHAGFEMKEKLVRQLKELGYEPKDMGATSVEASDYPDYAHPVARAVSKGEIDRGILLCGSGVGMDIVANRYPGVRAALAWQPDIAELSRKHNDSNVLVIPSRFVSDEQASSIMKRWLEAEFEGGRHQKRIEKIEPAEASR